MEEISWYEKIYKEQTGIRWGITLKDSEEIIGSIGFLGLVSQHYRAQIGFELSKSYWRKGIVSEALHAVLHFGFQQMDLQRIEALIEPANTASQRLVEHCGFMKEGLLRNYEFTSGKFDDLYMYSILKQDWKTTIQN